MASTSSETKEHAKRQTSLRRLINECNIHFHSIDEPLPSSLEREYIAVQAIEESTYATNLLQSSNVTNKRKNDILEAVQSCLDSENTEQDWRQEVEAEILYPLTKHHTCPLCSKRLWRADFEFPLGDEHSERWDNLRRRRIKRKTCACTDRPRENPRPRDRVFKYFRGKTVKYGPDVQRQVPTGLRPDLVVGLFNGRKASNILNAPARIDTRKRVGDLIKPDIFAKEGADVGHDSKMIFPFLVLEAKRPKAADSLEDMERQMALPAYEMLRTQKRLLENSTAVQANDRLPRVWLVSYKAQIWKLYVATTERDEDDEDAYNIYNLWSGDISGKADALKLVLLLDCIFDWALDIYRLDIYERLRSMMADKVQVSSAKLTPSVSDLSDTFGKMTMAPVSENLETIHEEVQDVIKYKQGWVRDARRVLVTGGGLLITAANIGDIFDTFEHPDHAKRFARLVWQLLRDDPWCFPSESILDRVREEWIGEKYNKQQVLEGEIPIYMQLEVYAYLDLNWQPTRKLIFVAITKDIIPELFRRTQDATGRTWANADEIEKAAEPVVNVEDFVDELRDYREAPSASENLREAIIRWHQRPIYTARRRFLWTPVRVPSCDKAVQEMFDMYQVGRKQPAESFLKIWHSVQPTLIAESENESCLVAGHTDERDWHRVDRRNRAPGLCIFVFVDLDDLELHKTAKTLRYWEKQGAQQLGYDYTVLRGKYLSGSTHFDDNRSEEEYISPWGSVFPRDVRRAMRPSPESLIHEWIQELKNDGTGDASPDEEDYYTDDSDHRGDCGCGLCNKDFPDRDEEEESSDSTEDEETETHTSDGSEADEEEEEEEESEEEESEEEESEEEQSEEESEEESSRRRGRWRRAVGEQ